MNESQNQSKRYDHRREEYEFAQAGLPVAPMEMKIESCAAQPPDAEKSVEPGVEEQQIAQSSQSGRPSPIEPTQIDGQPKCEKDQRIAPVAELLGIDHRRLPQQPRDQSRQEAIQGHPLPAKHVL